MIKRSEYLDHRMKYTAREIALYNAEAYSRFPHPMELVKGKEKWIPPNIEKVED